MEKAQLMTDAGLAELDVIFYDGEYLLVCLWFANQALGLRRPEFVIPLSSLHVNDDPNLSLGARFLIDGVFPRGLFLAPPSPTSMKQFGVQKGPDVTFPLASKN